MVKWSSGRVKKLPTPSCFLPALRLVACGLWFAAGSAQAAELYAKKMEIVRTPDGQVTLFRDSVRISDGETRISAGWARVSESRSLAVIGDSVLIRNPDAVINADSCVYRMDQKRTRLFGNVRVVQESLVVTAPRLEYVVNERKVYADSGLVVQGRSRDFRLEGERGSYDLGQDMGIVDRSPRMVRSQGDDSVTVLADEMRWTANASEALAAGNVSVRSGSAGMTCDSLRYFANADSGLAWGSPVVTDSVSRTTGDTVAMRVEDGNLDLVTISGSAQSTYRTEGGEFIEVAGKLIVVDIDEGEVGTIEVRELSYGRLVRSAGEEIKGETGG